MFSYFLPFSLLKDSEGKFKEISEGAAVLDKEDSTLFDRIQTSDYAYIQWKTNLAVSMKDEYLKTDACAYSLGELN